MIIANLTTMVANLTTMVANLALAWSINYDCEVRCKLKHTFTIINYDPKPFIVQATGFVRFILIIWAFQGGVIFG